MSKYFKCPICNQDIDLSADFGKMSNSNEPYEFRIGNKRFHMQQHKKVKLAEKKLIYLKEKVKKLEQQIVDDKSWIVGRHADQTTVVR